MLWREWNMILHVGAPKTTCHCWLLLSSFFYKVPTGQWTLAPGSFSRPGCIRDSISYASEQEGHQIFRKHTMSQPLPAFQLAQLEPCSMIHRGCFLNSWPSMETMKKHLELQSSNLEHSRVKPVCSERGVKQIATRGMIFGCLVICSQLWLMPNRKKKKCWRTPKSLPRNLQQGWKGLFTLDQPREGHPEACCFPRCWRVSFSHSFSLKLSGANLKGGYFFFPHVFLQIESWFFENNSDLTHMFPRR